MTFSWIVQFSRVSDRFDTIQSQFDIDRRPLSATFYPIRSNKTKTNLDACARIFPRFASATCIYFDFWLAPWIVDCPLWLARVTNLVLVLRKSIKKGSKEKIFLRDVLAVHRNNFNIFFLIIIIIIIQKYLY